MTRWCFSISASLRSQVHLLLEIERRGPNGTGSGLGRGAPAAPLVSAVVRSRPRARGSASLALHVEPYSESHGPWPMHRAMHPRAKHRTEPCTELSTSLSGPCQEVDCPLNAKARTKRISFLSAAERERERCKIQEARSTHKHNTRVHAHRRIRAVYHPQ